MTSLYSQYIKERNNHETLETDFGFLTYSISNTSSGGQIFIHDFFVKPENRATGEGRKLVEMALKVAKEHKCTHAMATVDPKTKGATEALVYQTKWGMSLLCVENGLIYLYMEIK